MQGHAKRCWTPILVVAVSGSAIGADIRWAMPQDGLWSEAINWDPMVVPGAQDDVRVDVPGLYTVRVLLDAFASSLTIAEGPTLEVQPGAELLLAGDVSNQSTLRVLTNATLRLENASAELSPSALLQSVGQGALISLNAVEHQGGTIEARSGGTVEMVAGRVSGATLRAAESGSTIELAGTRVQNSVLMSENQGAIRMGSGVLDSIVAHTPIVMSGGDITLSGALQSDLVFVDESVFPRASVVIRDALTVGQPYRIQTDLRFGVRIEGAGEFVIDPDLTINSGIEFGAQATNLGTLLLDQDAHFLILRQELLTSQGDIRLLADASAEIQSALENEGSIRIGGTSKVRFSHATMDQSPLAELLIEDSGELELSSSSYVGDGLMVRDQGYLDATSADIELAPGQVIDIAGADASMYIVSSTCSGGTVHIRDGAELVFASSEIENLHIEDADLITSVGSKITGQLTNDGTIGIYRSSLILPDHGVIDGEGVIELQANGSNTLIETETGALFTIGHGQIVQGFGTIGASFINKGTIIATDSDPIRLGKPGEVVQNTSLISASPNCLLRVEAGLFEQGASGIIEASALDARVVFEDSRVTGGQLRADDGVIWIEGDCEIDQARADGHLIVADNATLLLGPGLQFAGNLRVYQPDSAYPARLMWDPDQPPLLSGVVDLSGEGLRSMLLSSTQSSTPLRIPEGVRLQGSGTIRSDIEIMGELAPSSENEIGVLSAEKSVVFQPGAALHLRVDQGSADSLVSNQSIHIGGTLCTEPLDGSYPEGYWSRIVLLAPSITGGFDAIEALGIAEGRAIRVKHAGPILSIVHTCLTDFDLDGDQDFFDVSAFIDAYIAGDPGADLTGDGQMDFFDISTFLAAYQGGCDL